MLEYTKHLMLFIGISSVVWTSVSTCIYDTPLCECFYELVTCVGLQEVPPLNSQSDLYSITAVELKDGNISSISKDILPPVLEELLLSRHPVTNISDDAFDNIATTLEVLAIKEAQFQELPRTLLKLTELAYLRIGDTSMENWEADILKHLGSTITHLELLNVGLTVWPRWISNFHVLKKLDLSGNLLKTIPDNAFDTINQTLENLSLGNTGLTHVPRALWTLLNVFFLDLSGNNFSDLLEIEKLTLAPFIAHLGYLHVISVGMSRVLNFSNFTFLHQISMDNNNISEYTEGSFPLHVADVSLTGNHLSSVPLAIVSSCYLLFLNVSMNEISEIAPGTFHSRIETIDLRFNNLSVINSTTFTKLIYLRYLYLNDNPILLISLSAFSDCKFSFLSLDSTSLTEFPLALTNIENSFMTITINATRLSCQCPRAAELDSWYNGFEGLSVTGTCTDGRDIFEYFLIKCDVYTTPDSRASSPKDHAPGGRATTPPPPTTTTRNHSSAVILDLLCRHATSFLTIAVWFMSY